MRAKFAHIFVVPALVAILLSACAGPASPTSTPKIPSETPKPDSPSLSELFPSSTPTPTRGPKITNIVIDGNASDWASYQQVGSDVSGEVGAGEPDMVATKAFNNDKFFYLAIYLHDPSVLASYAVVVNVDDDEEPDYEIWIGIQNNSILTGAFLSNDMDLVFGTELAQTDIIELKVPLEAFGGQPVRSAFVHANGIGNGIPFNPSSIEEIEGESDEPAPTLLVIDSELADWTPYRLTTDGIGDAINGGPDIGAWAAFANDKSLYIMAQFETPGTWDDIAIDVTFEDGTQGQINLKDIYASWFTFHGSDERLEFPVEFEFSDSGFELKADLTNLANLRGVLERVDGIRIFNHAGGYGNTPLDSANTDQPLRTLNEFEP